MKSSPEHDCLLWPRNVGMKIDYMVGFMWQTCGSSLCRQCMVPWRWHLLCEMCVQPSWREQTPAMGKMAEGAHLLGKGVMKRESLGFPKWDDMNNSCWGGSEIEGPKMQGMKPSDSRRTWSLKEWQLYCLRDDYTKHWRIQSCLKWAKSPFLFPFLCPNAFCLWWTFLLQILLAFWLVGRNWEKSLLSPALFQGALLLKIQHLLNEYSGPGNCCYTPHQNCGNC